MSSDVALTQKQARAVAAILEQPTMAKAAEAVGVDVRTLERWGHLPQFRAALRDAQRAASEAAARRVAIGMGGALDVLQEIMEHPHERAANRIRAAAVWLAQAKLAELQDLEQRLAALEALMEEREHDREPG